jgi:hypothetical protein
MATTADRYTVELPADFDERAEYETPLKGYLGDVVVHFEDGARFQMFFIDPVRLQQELALDVQNGRPYLAEPNLVVVPEVTPQAIHKAVDGLVKDGFFLHLKPL